MKITKSQLKRLITEELGKLDEAGADDAEVRAAQDDAAAGKVSFILDWVLSMYLSWKPQTREGQRYKAQLGELYQSYRPETWEQDFELEEPATGGPAAGVGGI